MVTLAKDAGKPPVKPGFTCLQRAFKNWQTAENIAKALGIELTYSGAWVFVPDSAMGEICATQSRWAEEQLESRTITRDHASTRILERFVGFSVKFFAEQIGVPLRRPSQSEEEYFVRRDDLPLVLAAARKSNPDNPKWRHGPDAMAQIDAFLDDNDLRGRTERYARQERLIPAAWVS